jgi:uroporphyrinogen-III synthase
MKRVLITRSAAQASELADRLRALDLEPILIPTIEVTDPVTFGPLDAALAQLFDFGELRDFSELSDLSREPAFHWLVFTSANAVTAFRRRLSAVKEAALSLPVSEPAGDRAFALQGNLRAGFRIAAIGPATARALEAIGFSPDLIPLQAVAESLAATLVAHARQPDGSPTRFLLIRAEIARDHLPDTLRAAGAQVILAPAYRTVAPAESIAEIEGLFRTREFWPDAITFTSSSTATNLQALLEAGGLSLPAGILRISIGPITSQTLREMGFAPDAEATEPTLACLAVTIAQTIRLKAGR